MDWETFRNRVILLIIAGAIWAILEERQRQEREKRHGPLTEQAARKKRILETMSGLGCLLLIAIPVLYFLFGPASQAVSDYLQVGYGFALLAVLGLAFGVTIFVWVAFSLPAFFKRRKRCAHGVRRGKDGGCQTCIAEEERCQAAQAAQEKKAAICKEAVALRASELIRLRRAWLTNSESYFQMNSRQFEDAIAALFSKLDFEVKQTPYSGDRGRDAIATKDGKTYLIECKRYDADNTIGRRDLQIFVAAMKEENAQGGFYINTGRFAKTAAEYAAQNQIELYDRNRLPALVNRAYPATEDFSAVRVMCTECSVVLELPVAEAPTVGTCVNGHAVTSDITTARITSGILRMPLSGAPFTPGVCERCGSEMRLRNGWRGKFWGCTRYPDCTFTRDADQG